MLGADDRVAYGIPVHMVEIDKTKTTDAQGYAVFRCAAEAPEVRLAQRKFTLESAHTVLQLDDLIPVELVAVDTETGRVVPECGLSMRSGHDKLSPRSHVIRGLDTWVRAAVAPPDGLVYERGAVFKENADVSRYAERLRVVVPLRREVRVHLRIRNADGLLSASAYLSGARFGGPTPTFCQLDIPDDDGEPVEEPPPEPEEEILEEPEEKQGMALDCRAEPSGQDGWLDVRGVPYMPGEKLFLVVFGAGQRYEYAEIPLKHGVHSASREVWLPEQPNTYSCAGYGRMGYGIGCGRRSVHVGPVGSIAVKVLRKNGRPAHWARIVASGPVFRSTRAYAGEAEFTKLPAGTYWVEVREPGFVPTWQEVTVYAEANTKVELVEPFGRTAVVRVVDEKGKRAPFVALEVHARTTHIQLNDGVQQMRLFTDERGEVRLEGLPTYGMVRVTASFGTREGKVAFGAKVGRVTLKLGQEHRYK